jgi:RNA polymerase sigma-70 factor (ECF subfamily)
MTRAAAENIVLARRSSRNAGGTADGRRSSEPHRPDAVGHESLYEIAIVERVKGGDVAAYGALIDEYMRRAFAVAFRLLKHREDAEDLVQDAFCRALVHLHTLPPGRRFGPWLFAILINQGLNERQRRRRRTTEPLVDTLPDPSAVDPVRSDVRRHVTEAIAKLPERQRLIVEMFEIEGFTSEEIGEVLGVAPVTVRWHLHQARAALRRMLAPLRGDDDAR